jgi:hypothetical protein
MRSRAEHKPDLSQTAEKVYTGAIRLSRSMGNAAGRAREALPPLGALLVRVNPDSQSLTALRAQPLPPSEWNPDER